MESGQIVEIALIYIWKIADYLGKKLFMRSVCFCAEQMQYGVSLTVSALYISTCLQKRPDQKQFVSIPV